MTETGGNMPTQMDRIEEKVDKALILLDGGTEPAKGLNVRVDRLEQSESRRAYVTRTLVGAWLVLVAGTVWAWFTGKQP